MSGLSATPYYPWNPTDYLRISRFLSPERDLIFRRLLDLAWMSYACRLPGEPERLLEEIGLPASWLPDLTAVLAKFFEIHEGRYTCPWLDEIHARVEERAQRSRENGAKGGRRPAKKPAGPSKKPKGNPEEPSGLPPEPKPNPGPTQENPAPPQGLAGNGNGNGKGKVPPSDEGVTGGEAKHACEPCVEALTLATLLKSEILSTKPDAKVPADVRDWAIEFDRMIRLDRRRPERAATLIAWARRRRYWGERVFSAESFRRFYDQIDAEEARLAASPETPFRRAEHSRAPKRTDFTGGF